MSRSELCGVPSVFSVMKKGEGGGCAEPGGRLSDSLMAREEGKKEEQGSEWMPETPGEVKSGTASRLTIVQEQGRGTRQEWPDAMPGPWTALIKLVGGEGRLL